MKCSYLQPIYLFSHFMFYRWYDAHNVSPLFPFGHGLSYTTFDYSDMSIKITNSSEVGARVGSKETPTSVYHSTVHVGDELKAVDVNSKNEISSKSLSSNPLHPPKSTSPLPPNKPLPITSPNRFDSLLTVTVKITNTGTFVGTEIVQLYMSYPDTWGEPLRLLKGITNISLQPQESSEVKFDLSSQDLSVWDKDSHQWSLPCSYKEVNNYITYVRKDYTKEYTGVFDDDCIFNFFVGTSSRDFRQEGSIQIKN